MNFKSNSNLGEAGAWQRAGEGGWQPTRACKTRFTIKAKVVDNTTTTTTTTMRNRRGGEREGGGEKTGSHVWSGASSCADTECCVCGSFSFIKGNGFGCVFWHMLRPVWLWMSHRAVQHVMATSPGSNCGSVEVCQLAEREKEKEPSREAPLESQPHRPTNCATR